MQLETNEGYVNIMMYPYNPGSTEIKCNWWSYFSPYGKMKALVYVERLEVGLWDLATSMTADADEGWCVYRFKTKTYVDFAYEDVVDWTYLPSNTGSFTVSLTYGYPTVSYTTSTDKMSLSNDVLTRAVEWTVDVNNARLYPGQAFKIEPAIRASNTYGSFWFRRYYYAQFAVPNIIGYNTPYYYTTINMEVQ